MNPNITKRAGINKKNAEKKPNGASLQKLAGVIAGLVPSKNKHQ